MRQSSRHILATNPSPNLQSSTPSTRSLNPTTALETSSAIYPILILKAYNTGAIFQLPEGPFVLMQECRALKIKDQGLGLWVLGAEGVGLTGLNSTSASVPCGPASISILS